jgi:hypothetical protein
MFGHLFILRMLDNGKLSLLFTGLWACHVANLSFFVDLVNGQRPTHPRHKGRWLLLSKFGLASKRETNERRGSGRGQEIGRQFHFGLVSLSSDGSTSLKNGIEL